MVPLCGLSGCDLSTSQPVNPGTAMKEYVIVEYEQSDLSLFPSGYTPGAVTSDTTSNASSANTTTTSSGLSTGAKAGIGAGVGVAFLLALALLGLFFRKKWRQRKMKPVKQEIEYTGKPELDATSARKPIQGVAELPRPNYPTSIKELDSVQLYEVSGSSRREPTNSSVRTSSRADSAMADASQPPESTIGSSPPAAMETEHRAHSPTAGMVQLPVHGNLGTATTIEDLELQYLENEERRIQERKLQLLRARASP